MRIVPLTMIAFGFALPATGQLCAGSASFSGAPLRVSGNTEVTSDAHSFGVGLTLGGSATLFGVGLGTTHFDALHGSSFDVAAGGGCQLRLAQPGGIQLCPGVAVGHGAGPKHPPHGGD